MAGTSLIYTRTRCLSRDACRFSTGREPSLRFRFPVPTGVCRTSCPRWLRVSCSLRIRAMTAWKAPFPTGRCQPGARPPSPLPAIHGVGLAPASAAARLIGTALPISLRPSSLLPWNPHALLIVEYHGPGQLPVLQHAESVAGSGDGIDAHRPHRVHAALLRCRGNGLFHGGNRPVFSPLPSDALRGVVGGLTLVILALAQPTLDTTNGLGTRSRFRWR